MFIWTSGRTSSSYRHDEKRNIYQKIRDHDLLDKRKTVTALKAGEDRAILLGLAMMVSLLFRRINNCFVLVGGFHNLISVLELVLSSLIPPKQGSVIHLPSFVEECR
uniref:Calcium-activated potassium channel subunit beta-2 n=1 Tax=Homo sapiens TaxID=9606 RepID=B5BNW7_HUMAN|nr:large-conductance Ca2+-activated K+ channel beta2 subunit [Homo sapiens]